MAQLAGFGVWLKSKDQLAGPWDWIIMSAANQVIDFEGPFATRDQATENLAAYLDGLLPSTAAPALVEVPAADDVEAPAAAPLAAAIAGDVDPEMLGLAVDLAMASLRNIRARIAGGRSAR